MPFVKGQPGGPGRKRKADKFARPIARAEKQIADQLPALITNMLTLANGVLVEDTNPVTGNVQIYQKPPDRAANEYLINRILVKPIERQEIGGVDGGPIEVAFVNYRTGITDPSEGSGDDSDSPGEGESAEHGPALG